MNAISGSGKRALVVAVVVFLVILIIPIFLIGKYLQISQNLNSQVVVQQQTLSDLASLALKVRLDKLAGIASSLATSTPLASYMAEGQWSNAADTARDLENNINYYDSFIDRIIIVDASGTQQAAYPMLMGGVGTNASGSAWYQAFMKGGGSLYISNVTKRTTLPQLQVINIVAPVYSSNKTVGFLILQIPTDNFLEFAGNLELGTYGFGYIVDPVGNIVAHPKYFSDINGVVNYSFVPEVQKVIAGQTGTDVVSDNTDGEKSIITYKPVEKYGWGIITQEPYAEAFSNSSGILLAMQCLIAIALLIDLLIAYAAFRIALSQHDK